MLDLSKRWPPPFCAVQRALGGDRRTRCKPRCPAHHKLTACLGLEGCYYSAGSAQTSSQHEPAATQGPLPENGTTAAHLLLRKGRRGSPCQQRRRKPRPRLLAGQQLPHQRYQLHLRRGGSTGARVHGDRRHVARTACHPSLQQLASSQRGVAAGEQVPRERGPRLAGAAAVRHPKP